MGKLGLRHWKQCARGHSARRWHCKIPHLAFCHPTVPEARAEKGEGEKKKKPYQGLSINESHMSILGLSAHKGWQLCA